MNNKFAELLKEYLDSECDDYGLSYTWNWNEDTECCEVTVKQEHTGHSAEVDFRFDESKESLTIELSEDCYHETHHYDQTVKYFWMLISPSIFK